MSKMNTIQERMNSGMYINYIGNEIYNKPYNDQYNFDEYIEWINPSFFDREINSINSNQLENDIDYSELSVIDIENILKLYFNEDIEIISVSKMGYNNEIIWTFYYRNKINSEEYRDEKMYSSFNELDEIRYRKIPFFVKPRRQILTN